MARCTGFPRQNGMPYSPPASRTDTAYQHCTPTWRTSAARQHDATTRYTGAAHQTARQRRISAYPCQLPAPHLACNRMHRGSTGHNPHSTGYILQLCVGSMTKSRSGSNQILGKQRFPYLFKRHIWFDARDHGTIRNTAARCRGCRKVSFIVLTLGIYDE